MVGTAAAVFGCGLIAAALAAPTAPAAKMKLVFTKARVVSDGIVTPGELETISVSRLPRRTKLQVFVEPPPTTPECGEKYFCSPARVFPAPGTAPFRSSGRGRAQLTFVAPSTYWIATDPFRPKQGRLQTFADGQAVHLDVQGIKRTKRAKRVGFGFGRAVIQLPPPS